MVDLGSRGNQMSNDNFILLVARNNLHLTRLAVNSALAQDIPCTVMLIDNASSDNTARYAAGKAGIVYVAYREQKSLSACWNAGLRAAWATGHEHALLVNNDVELRPDAYRLLLAHGGPFVTCVSVDSAEQVGIPTTQTGCAVQKLYFDGYFDWNQRPHPDFSAFMIRKSVTDQIGWFDESMYPAYCEDSDYHVRMHQAGIPAVCIDLPFLHHGASTVKHADPAERRMIQKGADLNRARFKAKYGCLPGSDEYQELFR